MALVRDWARCQEGRTASPTKPGPPWSPYPFIPLIKSDKKGHVSIGGMECLSFRAKYMQRRIHY